MKILVTGSAASYALENIYIRHLNTLGAQCELFPAHDVYREYISASLLHRALNRLGAIPPVCRQINRNLLERAEALKPDIVWVFKGMEIYPQTIQQLRAMNIKTVNFNPDHPFIFSGTGSGNKNVSASFPHFDVHITYIMSLRDELEHKYGSKVWLLPFGYELPDADFETISAEQEVNRVCFVGNPDRQRAAFINRLLEAGMQLDVYGFGWNRYLRHAGCNTFTAVLGLDYWRMLRRYRVQLNIFRRHNEGNHNMRTFEVPAAGGIQAAPDNREHRHYFEPGKHIFLYRNADDLPGIAASLMQMSSDEAGAIRMAARKHSVEEGYSYLNRAGYLLKLFENSL